LRSSFDAASRVSTSARHPDLSHQLWARPNRAKFSSCPLIPTRLVGRNHRFRDNQGKPLFQLIRRLPRVWLGNEGRDCPGPSS
jgi:hypothetical protein